MKAKALNIHTNKVIFLAMLSLSALSVVLYMFLVNLTVHNIVNRQAMEAGLSTQTAQVNELESEYVILKNSVTLGLATSLGFQPTDQTIYVTRQPTVAFAGGENLSR